MTDSNNTFRNSAVETGAADGQPNSCYATLGSYNARQIGTINAPVLVEQSPSQKVQAIPVWGSFGYDAFSHGQDYRCGGYFSIEGAYPDYANKCGKYVRRACAGTVALN